MVDLKNSFIIRHDISLKIIQIIARSEKSSLPFSLHQTHDSSSLTFRYQINEKE